MYGKYKKHTMEVFKNFLRQIVTSESAQELSPVTATTTEEQKDVVKIKVKFEHDVKALQQAGFALSPGSLIELTLPEALKLMPRDRKRSDAYNSLVKYLDAEYGCRLIVSSKKKSNQKKGNKDEI